MGSLMRKNLPGRRELAVFAVMALLCATVVHMLGKPDAGLSLLSFPVFVFCAILGSWRSGRWREG
jgi:hypothetical protein